MPTSKLLWTPSPERARASQMHAFLQEMAAKFGFKAEWETLRNWSIERPDQFWGECLNFVGIEPSAPAKSAMSGAGMLGTKWFEGMRLNYARHLLRLDDDNDALIFEDERGQRGRMSHRELRAQVARCAAALRGVGVRKGDRVAGFMPNIPETIIAMLAAASIGAIWSSCSPDFGVRGILDRFGQIEPTVLFACDGYTYNGKPIETVSRIREMLPSLPSVKRAVFIPFLNRDARVTDVPNAVMWADFLASAVGASPLPCREGAGGGFLTPLPPREGTGGGSRTNDPLPPREGAGGGSRTNDPLPPREGAGGGSKPATAATPASAGPHPPVVPPERADGAVPPLTFEEVPFDHPLFIMYSSGTTGVPKCIVHGHGGTLLQHMKELMLHTDLRAGERIFYFTTCGWMMWNWLVSGLGVGATLVLFEGNPGYPDMNRLWKLAAETKLHVFGTSAKYLASCEKAAINPGRDLDLSNLRCVCSTGSPLSAELFEWTYDHVKRDLQLASICGGTDIISCFILGNPMLPVFSGEIQCRGLGMDVHAWDENQQSVKNEKGELICATPFPCQPVCFWNDPDGAKYRGAYFDYYGESQHPDRTGGAIQNPDRKGGAIQNPDRRGGAIQHPDCKGGAVQNPDREGGAVWRHGDFIEITDTGGIIVYGRSDATLNPGGVRIGTAEIYRVVEGITEIVDSIVVGHDTPDQDVDVCLFVVLRPGVTLDAALEKRIRNAIAAGATKRHVPRHIKQVHSIPYTISGKKVELAVRRMIHGQDVPNKDALANPDALEEYRGLV